MIIDFNRYNGGGGSGSGVTPQEVQRQIDSALTPYWDSAITESAITEAVSGLATEQYVQDALSGVSLEGYWNSAETQDAISAATSGKADAANIQPNPGNYRLPSWNEQGIVTGALGNAYTNSITINGVSKSYWGRGNGNPDPFYAPLSAGTAGDILVSVGSGAPVWSAMPAADVTKAYVDSADTALQDQIDTMDEVVSAALVDLNDRVDEISGATPQIDLSGYTPTSGFSTINGSAITNGGNLVIQSPDMSGYYTSGQTDAAIATATQDVVKTYDDYSQGYVRQIIKLTQSDYDALVQYGQVDPDTFYIIVNSN